MTHVDFYILPDDQLITAQRYVCKLAEHNWQSGKRVLIQTDSAEESHQLDDLLWNIQDHSFIPHGVATLELTDQHQPILISHQKINDENFQSVLNLSSRPADICIENEIKIDEILNQDEQRKLSGRQHYKVYRELGYTLEHHILENTND